MFYLACILIMSFFQELSKAWMFPNPGPWGKSHPPAAWMRKADAKAALSPESLTFQNAICCGNKHLLGTSILCNQCTAPTRTLMSPTFYTPLWLVLFFLIQWKGLILPGSRVSLEFSERAYAKAFQVFLSRICCRKKAMWLARTFHVCELELNQSSSLNLLAGPTLER